MSQPSTVPRDKTQNVLVILGSTRAGRLCPRITEWVIGIARSRTTFEYEQIDLRDWPLPADDEPGIPALGSYATEHTRAWSRKVAAAAAFVIVTPQYNWGYPAPLKNALDHLYREWAGKPLMIVSYGGHGGNKCAAQLRQVADGLHMRTLPTMPGIVLSEEIVKGAAFEPQTDFAAHIGTIRDAFGELQGALKD